jgi:hypothetical protein
VCGVFDLSVQWYYFLPSVRVGKTITRFQNLNVRSLGKSQPLQSMDTINRQSALSNHPQRPILCDLFLDSSIPPSSLHETIESKTLI